MSVILPRRSSQAAFRFRSSSANRGRSSEESSDREKTILGVAQSCGRTPQTPNTGARVPRRAIAETDFDSIEHGNEASSVRPLRSGLTSGVYKRTAEIDEVGSTEARLKLHVKYRRVADIDTVLAAQAAKGPKSDKQRRHDCNWKLDFLSDLDSLLPGLEQLVAGTRILSDQTWKTLVLQATYSDIDPSFRTKRTRSFSHLSVVEFFVQICTGYQIEIVTALRHGQLVDGIDFEEEMLDLLTDVLELGDTADSKGAEAIEIVEEARPGTKALLESQGVVATERDVDSRSEEDSEGSDSSDDEEACEASTMRVNSEDSGLVDEEDTESTVR